MYGHLELNFDVLFYIELKWEGFLNFTEVIATKKNPVIQGLRALAVVSVLLFHAGVPWVKGGFLGVDIFFSISGYVITLLLQKELLSGHFSFFSFYEKRAWRLLPALAVCLVSTSFIFSLLTPSPYDKGLTESLLFASFGVSNFYFSNGVDYFDSGTLNPVLHTWSLGVEEQFYFIYPLFLYLVHKSPSLVGSTRKKLILIGCLILIGLSFAVFKTSSEKMDAFYFPWLRAWEFLGGSAVAILGAKRENNSRAGAATYSGAVLLILVLLFYSEDLLFPGLGAVVPVIATMLLLYGSNQKNLINDFLSCKPNLLIGNASYSIYLFHWPVVCLVAMFFSLGNGYVQILVIMCSLVLGVISWHCVEKKLSTVRFKTLFSWRAISPILLMLVTASSVLLAASTTKYYWNLHPMAISYFGESVENNDYYKPGACFITSVTLFSQYSPDECLAISPGKENVLVMGDSLAANIVSALREQYPSKNFMQATAVEFRPGNKNVWPDYARELWEVLNQRLLSNNTNANNVTLLLTARWRREDLPPLLDFVEAMKSKRIKVIVLGPLPEYYGSVPMILAHTHLFGFEIMHRLFKKERLSVDDYFRRELETRVDYISVLSLLCPDAKCLLERNGKSLYFDKVHYTRDGARYFASKLEQVGILD